MLKRVAVVGAGPSGLAAARHLTAPGSPFECQVFEQGDDLGGTWRFSRHMGTDPSTGRPVHSSMYTNLRTNLPKEVMCYPDFPFDDGLDKFLTAEQVVEYLNAYAEKHELRKSIKFNHMIKEVTPMQGDNGVQNWKVEIEDLVSNKTYSEIFEAIIVANGHYAKPNIPTFPGMDDYTGRILHSHDYRDADNFSNQSVLVVGGSFSALDIMMQIANKASKVSLSHHLKELKVTLPDNVVAVPDVDHFDQSQVHFTDGSKGKFDSIILCTGFKYDFPFLNTGCKISSSGYGVEPLYKHCINIEHPTMCFLVLADHVSPMQLADLEVRFFMKYLTGEMELPDKEQMYAELKADQKMRQEKLGLGPRYAHKFGCLQKSHYEDLATTAGIQGIHPDVVKYILQARGDFCVLTSQCGK